MCEKPEPPENQDITEGQEPMAPSNVDTTRNIDGGKPMPPDNETITKGD